MTATDIYGEVTSYKYDRNTGVLMETSYATPKFLDAGGEGVVSTSYQYDSMYRAVQATHTRADNTSASIGYGYANDLLTTVTTPSTSYNFTYGDFGKTESLTIGNSIKPHVSYTYGLTDQVETLDYANGDKVKYTYDAVGRVIKLEYMNSQQQSQGSVQFLYDSRGQLAQIVDSAGGSITCYYDALGRPVCSVAQAGDIALVTGNEYDSLGRLSGLTEEVYLSDYVTNSYTYRYGSGTNDKGLVTSVETENLKQTYAYDAAHRLTTSQTYHKTSSGTSVVVTNNYAYATGANSGWEQIQAHSITHGSTSWNYTYQYDSWGNIRTISLGGSLIASYEYDSANQLIRENNAQAGKTWTWTYDEAGNITSRKEYNYTTGALGTGTTTSYTYGNSQWGDLLTGYNGNTVTSDAMGNMLSDGTRSFTWEHGSQLKTLTKGGQTWTYTYDGNGMRTGRSNGSSATSTSYSYVYNGDRLAYMSYNGMLLQFTYSATGAPIGVTVRSSNGSSSDYYYITNIQGDVIAIIDYLGNTQVSYAYDAWGKIVSISGPAANSLGQYNPLRYRGYVYDEETGLYYLQSRYYDPQLGRFISADDQINTGSTTGLNLFAYCGNNPVMRVDPTGHAWEHWILAGLIVVGFGIATIVTCGGSLALAANAVFLASYGIAAGSAATTIAATGFVLSGLALGSAALFTATCVDNLDEFAEAGSWWTVGTVAFSGILGSGTAALENAISSGKLEIGKIKGVRASVGYPGIRLKTAAGPAYSIEFHGSHNKHTPHLQINTWVYQYRRYEGQPYRLRSWRFEFFKPWKGVYS